MAKFVADKLSGNMAATVLVAGDLNVGETDASKNGFQLAVDKFSAAEGDLYDETHAILTAGLIDRLHMASLTKGLGTETYDDPQSAGSGPIDCIYVAGTQVGDFTLATKSSQAFGSDHIVVSVRFLFSGTPPTPVEGGGTAAGVRISALLLPNPEGRDVGQEWVKLKNHGRQSVSNDGWTLRDESDNSIALIGTIAPRAELTIQLAEGQLPLNNGDEIELLDAGGNSVHVVSYSSGQAVPGQVIHISP
jgi:hypothetical protein